MVDKAKMAKAMRRFAPVSPIGNVVGKPLILPNFNKGKAPESEGDLANKKYVDDEVAGISVSGDNLGNHIATQTVSGAYSYWTGDIKVDGSVDGIDIAGMSGFVTANTSHRGGDGSDHSDVVANTASGAAFLPLINANTASGAAFLPLINANTDKISYTDAAQFQVVSGALATHTADSTDPHGANLSQTGLIISARASGASIAVTGDRTASGTALVSNIVYAEASGGLIASNYPIGSVLVVHGA